MSDKIGPTGQFPDGKIDEDDKGEIRFAIGIYEENIFIDFGTPVGWLAMEPDMALHLAGKLIIKAGEQLKIPLIQAIGETFANEGHKGFIQSKRN